MSEYRRVLSSSRGTVLALSTAFIFSIPPAQTPRASLSTTTGRGSARLCKPAARRQHGGPRGGRDPSGRALSAGRACCSHPSCGHHRKAAVMAGQETAFLPHHPNPNPLFRLRGLPETTTTYNPPQPWALRVSWDPPLPDHSGSGRLPVEMSKPRAKRRPVRLFVRRGSSKEGRGSGGREAVENEEKE